MAAGPAACSLSKILAFPFEQKMPRLVAELNAQFAESAKLEKAINANLLTLETFTSTMLDDLDVLAEKTFRQVRKKMLAISKQTESHRKAIANFRLSNPDLIN